MTLLRILILKHASGSIRCVTYGRVPQTNMCAMKGSGKQILDRILDNLSTKICSEEEIPAATKQLQAGLLLHGSTADNYFEFAARLAWGSSFYEAVFGGGLARQGIVTKVGGIFISDVFECMREKPDM